MYTPCTSRRRCGHQKIPNRLNTHHGRRRSAKIRDYTSVGVTGIDTRHGTPLTQATSTLLYQNMALIKCPWHTHQCQCLPPTRRRVRVRTRKNVITRVMGETVRSGQRKGHLDFCRRPPRVSGLQRNRICCVFRLVPGVVRTSNLCCR